MSKFKVGDQITRVDGMPFDNGELICTVDELAPYLEAVWLQETDSWVRETDIKLSQDNQPQNNMSKFKVGDKVKHATLEVFGNGDKIRTIKSIAQIGIPVWFEETDTWLYQSDLELVQASPNNKQHKHHDLIVAWANGAEIQFKNSMSDGWVDCFSRNPQWLVNSEYRIKPEKSDRDVVIESIQNHINELQTHLNNLKE